MKNLIQISTYSPKTLISFLFICTGWTLLIQCSKDEIIAPTPPRPDYTGSWIGKTSQNYEISFLVMRDTVRNMKIRFNVTGNCLHSGLEVTYYQGFPIFINFFNNNDDTNIFGKFNSSTSVSGEFSAISTDNPRGCISTAKGTWTATKQ